MKKLTLFSLALLPLSVFGQSSTSGIESVLSPVVEFLNKIVFFEIPIGGDQTIPFVLVWLILGAIIFTFYMRFVNIRGFRHALDVLRGRYDNPDNPGEITHFQALSTALGATLGIGNIAGVAIAISLGGPGAVFWLLISGFLGMSSKFVECTLGVKYREKYGDGSVSGGGMYYISKGLAKQNLKTLGKFLGGFFAVACLIGSIGVGNLAQSNQAAIQLANTIGSPFLKSNLWILGLILAILVGLVIIGGIKIIAKVTSKLVPFMICHLYR